jgi:MMP 1-O-methyltransferase
MARVKHTRDAADVDSGADAESESGRWREVALATKGFMPADEGDALYAAALDAAARVPGAPLVEIGTYCGRSTLWLGAAARVAATVLYTVDHHRGSEELQAGWDHHDPELVVAATGRMDSLAFARAAVERAGLEGSVVMVVGASAALARVWGRPAALVFIDGGHGADVARTDYESWATHVAPGGTLAVHDVFSDPADGGQAPYEQIYLPALQSGLFVEDSVRGSLHCLRRH